MNRSLLGIDIGDWIDKKAKQKARENITLLDEIIFNEIIFFGTKNGFSNLMDCYIENVNHRNLSEAEIDIMTMVFKKFYARIFPERDFDEVFLTELF